MSSYKNSVYQSYDKISKWYDEHRSRDLFEKTWLDVSISYLTSGAKILDLGCGIGEPISRYFIEQEFCLTGIDVSKKLLDLAIERFPQANFICTDMREIKLNQKFDLIIAWHSFFHLTQNDQRAMFKTFTEHLTVNGVLLFTTGPTEGEIWSDNGGESLYHASLSPKEYKKLLNQHGFNLLSYQVNDEHCGGATVWLAQNSPSLF